MDAINNDRSPPLSLAHDGHGHFIAGVHHRCVVSHVLYGSVKITSYDRLQADSDSNASRLRGSNQQGGQPQLASLRESGWHNAPHTSRLSPGVANIHELEAGGDGEKAT